MTRNRRQWLPKAIACWRAQTYRNSELLILADGEDVRDLAVGEGIRYAQIPGKPSIGDKRNMGCEMARGEVICCWDDDDYSAPHRLERQLARLGAADVTGYNAMLFTDGAGWWKYTGGPGYALGTSLCFRRSFWKKHPFGRVHVGEDMLFSARAAAHNTLCSLDAGDEMYATIHPDNTGKRHVDKPQWRKLEDQYGLFGCADAGVSQC